MDSGPVVVGPVVVGPVGLGPVVVVGAGPTGLTAALLLARRGVRVLVLERRLSPYPLPRAVHLDDEAVRVLQAAGVAEAFAPLTRQVPGMQLLDARHRVMAEFLRGRAVGDHGWPQANLFDQPDLERLLRDAVAAQPLVTLRLGAEVVGLQQDAAGVDVRLAGGEVLRAAAVLGCDGATGDLRDLVGAGLRDLGFRERWLVVDALSSEQLPVWAGVQQVCDPRRAATFMQVGPERYRWELRLHDGEDGAQVLADRALLAPWLGSVPAERLQVLRQAEYVFTACLAERWRTGRVLLLGDAAHQTPPFIGQGLGSGLRDAHNVAWKLAEVLAGAPDALLDTYQSEREPHARRLIRLATVVGWAMTGGQDRAAAVRRTALAAACRVPGLTDRALDQVTPPLGPGALARRGLRHRAVVGRPVVQPWVAVGGSRRRLDDALPDGWCVLTTDGAGGLTAPWAPAGPEVVRLGREVVDADGALGGWLGRHRLCAVLLRPDRVVAAAR